MIVGPGAIGTLFGAYLARAGHDVRVLDHEAGRAALIAERGLRVIEADEEWSVPVHASTEARRLRPADIVCICVKAYDTDQAARDSQPLVSRKTTVVSIQNGLANGVQLAVHVGAARVVCAATSQGGSVVESGCVRHAGYGATLLGSFYPNQAARARHIAALFEAAGIPASQTDNTPGLIWSKLAINAAINPVTALWDVANGDILERPELLEMAKRAALEAEEVARAKGVSLLFADAGDELERVCLQTRTNVSSMCQDLRQGRQTEVGQINGAVVREARRLDIDVPINEMLLRRVATIEAGR